MSKYTLKPTSAAVLSSALVLSSLTGFSATADAATKVKNVTSSAKIKKGKLVKKSDGKIIKGYASYKSVIYKDGKKFKGLLNKRYYNNGKKATGLYKSKYYKNGLLGTGSYKNNYYKKGSLFTGKIKGVYYQKGKIFTGVTSKGNYYKKGKLGTGSYKGFYYSVGKKLTGLTSKGVYYKNGKLGNGIYKDILYKSGKPFNGTLKDEVYINGKVDSNKTANLVFTNAKTAFTKYEASFNTAQKNVEDLADLAKKAGVTTSKAASLQVKSAQDIQDFIAKYSNTDFTTLTEAQLETFKAELDKHTAEANTNLEEASKLVQTSTISLLNAIAVMKSFATEVQKAEFTKLATQANIVIHALKEAGADTSKLEEALKDTEIKVPEIETPGGGDTPGTGEENPGAGEENPGTGEGNNGGSNNGGGNETQDAITKAIKAAETAVAALENDPTQDKIKAAEDAVAALIALKSDYDVLAFNKAITNAQNLVDAAKADAIAKAVETVNAAIAALDTDPTQENINTAKEAVKALLALDKDFVVSAFNTAITEAQSLVDAAKADAIAKAVETVNAAITALDTDTTQENINTAKEAVKALLALDKEFDVSAFNTAITEAQNLVKSIEDLQAKINLVDADTTEVELTNLKAEIDAFSPELLPKINLTNFEDFYGKHLAKQGLLNDGTLAFAGEGQTFDSKFTFQMAGIYKLEGTLTFLTEGEIKDTIAAGTLLSQAKELSLEEVNKALALTLTKLTGSEKTKDNFLTIITDKKYGNTTFELDAHNMTAEEFKVLDGNKDNSYKITVNSKNPIEKKYKIELSIDKSNNEDLVVAKFISLN